MYIDWNFWINKGNVFLNDIKKVLMNNLAINNIINHNSIEIVNILYNNIWQSE
jgi:hypothetical protein